MPKRTVLADIERGLLKAQKLPGPLGAWVVDPDDFAEYRHMRAARVRRRRAALSQAGAAR